MIAKRGFDASLLSRSLSMASSSTASACGGAKRGWRGGDTSRMMIPKKDKGAECLDHPKNLCKFMILPTKRTLVYKKST
ncbi:hypothetical protein DsansV1_C13g0124211 [Dioscorea sansibarensis]